MLFGMSLRRVQLGELGELRQGLTLSRYLDAHATKTHHILQVANLEGTKVVKHDEDRREGLDETRIGDHIAREGQVLIALRGASLKAAVVPPELEDAVVSSSLVLFMLNRAEADPTFIAGLLSSKAMQARVTPLFTGLTVQGIPLARFKKIEINLPPLDRQQACARAFEAFEQYRQAVVAVLDLRSDELDVHLQNFVIKEQG